MAFIDKLAYCYEQGWYDLRDEWACTLSASIMEHLKEKQLYYSQIKDRQEMANWASTSYRIESKQKDLQEIYDLFMEFNENGKNPFR